MVGSVCGGAMLAEEAASARASFIPGRFAAPGAMAMYSCRRLFRESSRIHWEFIDVCLHEPAVAQERRRRRKSCQEFLLSKSWPSCNRLNRQHSSDLAFEHCKNGKTESI